MIYVQTEKVKSKHEFKRIRKKPLVLIGIVAVFVFIFTVFVRLNVNPMIVALSEAKTRAMTEKAVAKALTETVKSNIAYFDLINIRRDENGKITAMQTNTLRINLLAREASERAQKNLENDGRNGIEIPIGSLTGIPIFTGKGTKIKVKVVPVGSVICTFKSEFISCGINQTLHRIFIRFEAEVNIILAGDYKTLELEQEMLLCENLFIGEVPGVYLQTGNLDEALNLVPMP